MIKILPKKVLVMVYLLKNYKGFILKYYLRNRPKTLEFCLLTEISILSMN